jgi:protein TonB
MLRSRPKRDNGIRKMLELIFKIRQWFASAPALIALVFIVLSAQSIKLLDAKPAAPQIMQLSMVSLPTPPAPAPAEPEPAPEPPVEPESTPPESTPPIEPEPEPDVPAPIVEIPKPEPPKPEPPKPKEVKPKEHKPVEPKPKEPKPKEPKPVVTKKAAEPKTEPAEPKAAPGPAQPPAAEVVAPKPVAPEPKPNLSAAAEANYAAQVRADLNANKRYPTGREASLTQPAGTVRVWMVLNRQGEVVDSGIEATSHSMLLDRAALSTVRRANFPPFPAESWSGAATHRFTVDMNYQPAQ